MMGILGPNTPLACDIIPNIFEERPLDPQILTGRQILHYIIDIAGKVILLKLGKTLSSSSSHSFALVFKNRAFRPKIKETPLSYVSIEINGRIHFQAFDPRALTNRKRDRFDFWGEEYPFSTPFSVSV